MITYKNINSSLFRFYTGLHWNCCFKEINSINNLDESKLGRSTEHDYDRGDKPSYSKKIWFHMGFT